MTLVLVCTALGFALLGGALVWARNDRALAELDHAIDSIGTDSHPESVRRPRRAGEVRR